MLEEKKICILNQDGSQTHVFPCKNLICCVLHATREETEAHWSWLCWLLLKCPKGVSNWNQKLGHLLSAQTHSGLLVGKCHSATLILLLLLWFTHQPHIKGMWSCQMQMFKLCLWVSDSTDNGMHPGHLNSSMKGTSEKWECCQYCIHIKHMKYQVFSVLILVSLVNA